MSNRRAVWKYALPMADEVVVCMPEHAQVLHIAAQNNQPQIWAQVDPSAPIVDRVFEVRGTGHTWQHDPRRVHLGTFMLHGGGLVFHVFEVLK
ncbi:MAG: hypothetical protein EOO54_03720 [Haliea sp.]|nr:MAG: hypothetical protein EOO54_03720 [Haliea sp.]